MKQKIRAVVYLGPKHLEIQEVPIPKIEPNEILR